MAVDLTSESVRVAPDKVTKGLTREGVVLVGLLIALAVEPAQLTFGSSLLSGPLRWLVIFPAYGLCFWFWLRSPAPWSMLRGFPLGTLAATGIWLIVTSPFGLVPEIDLVLSFGFLAIVGYGAWFVKTLGWPEFRLGLYYALAVILIWSTVLIAVVQGVDGRWAGVFGSANGLGAAAAFMIVVGGDQVVRGQRYAVLFVVLSLVLLVGTDSRTSMVSALAGVIVLAQRAVRVSLGPLLAVTVIGLIGVVIAFGTPEGVTQRLSRSGTEAELVTATGRTYIWETSLDAIQQRPFSGYGSGSSTEVLTSAFAAAPAEGFEAESAHNGLLQLGLNGGVVAVVLAFSGIVVFAKRSFAQPMHDRDALMVALFVHSLTEAVIREPQYALLMLAAAMATVSSPTVASPAKN